MKPTHVVLVVDDNEHHRFIMHREVRRATRKHGSLTLEAENAETALERLPAMHKEHAKVLIISDYRMPGMNGLDLLAAIRANPQWDDIEFVLTSSSENTIKFDEAMALGAFDAFMKPLDLIRFRARLVDVVQRWHAHPIGTRPDAAATGQSRPAASDQN